MAILIVFMISWGVAEVSLLYATPSSIGSTLRMIVFLPFYQMLPNTYASAIQGPPYDMVGDDECTEEIDSTTKIRCSDKSTNWIVMLLLMLYMVIANLLLLNIIVAIFTQTFEDIEGK